MAKRTIDNLKLGIFVLTALALLILFLYMLGRNQSIFSKRFEIKAHFENVGGLIAGNNVRVSGIVVGIVEEVALVNDTLVVVTIALDDEMRTVLRKNALASIGTDGLIGNRVVNLLPVREPAPLIEPGDIIQAQKDVSTEEMLRTLDQTNKNVLVISRGLIETIGRINKSSQLAALLDDESLSQNLGAALANLRRATGQADATMQDLHAVVVGVRNGEGSVGALLRDTSFAYELNQTVRKLQTVEDQADLLAQDMRTLVQGVESDLRRGQGPVRLLLTDSLAAARVQRTLGNLEEGTARFSEDMEALKHNFLFRRYFRKLEKQKKKAGGE
ncbi:MAG: MCE family protein [Saprospirales bacterium]|nr:MCE family protein [Saprospirales bacterium]MBK8921190.1 MCE family protein [Saprospirales bacterium]